MCNSFVKEFQREGTLYQHTILDQQILITFKMWYTQTSTTGAIQN